MDLGYIWPAASSLSVGPGEDGLGPLWELGGAIMAGLPCLVSWSSWHVSSAREGAEALGSCSCVCWSGHHNSAPSSQAGWGGRRKDLRWLLSKPGGFRCSMGLLGGVVFPGQTAQLPELVRGLGCPLPRRSPSCSTLAGKVAWALAQREEPSG